MNAPLTVTLIIGTKDRDQVLVGLFESLTMQQGGGFDVVLVDQNPDDRLVPIVAGFSDRFPIQHLRQSGAGLSRARNLGRQFITGALVGFPDDDSVYLPDTLTRVRQVFTDRPDEDIVIGRVLDTHEDVSAYEVAPELQSAPVDYRLGYTLGISHAMFFRAAIAAELAFDERLGVGAATPWRSAEDADYLFQALALGTRAYYDVRLCVRHPSPQRTHRFIELLRREFSYGLGNGYFLGKHRLPIGLRLSATTAYYQQAVLSFLTARPRRAAVFLSAGVGTSIGYGAGLLRRLGDLTDARTSPAAGLIPARAPDERARETGVIVHHRSPNGERPT